MNVYCLLVYTDVDRERGYYALCSLCPGKTRLIDGKQRLDPNFFLLVLYVAAFSY